MDAPAPIPRIPADLTRLQLALDRGIISLWDWDIPSGRVYVAPRLYTILGYEPADIPPDIDHWLALMHPDDYAVVHPQVLAWLDDDAPEFEVEFRIRSRSGHWVWLLSRGQGVARDADGKVTRVIGTHIDVTRRKQAEAALRDAQKLESIALLAGGVAHDFNNVMLGITGFAELALHELPADHPATRMVREIRAACDDAIELTRQLLAFGRKQVFALQPLKLNDLIAGMEEMLRRLIGERIELRTELAPEVDRVRADGVQLRQVIMNLVINARDAMPDGGRLTIATSRAIVEESAATPSGGLPPGPYAVISVADTGHGMDSATLGCIFSPFFTTKTRGKGTGLGLAVAHGVVKQHGGDIQVTSEPGQGARFCIYLPESQEQVTLQPGPQRAADRSTGGETIMVVEDNDMVRRVVCTMLAARKYRVLEASDPEQALRLAAEFQGRIDLLFTDIVMPQMTGPELCERLRASFPDLRVLYMSGYSDAMIPPGIDPGGGPPFLQKPFGVQAACERVREVLDQPGPAAPLLGQPGDPPPPGRAAG